MKGRAVVIGAGITGTLTAHALTSAGWHVTLVEARSVGAGSSSRTAAGIRQQFSTPETVLGMRYAVDFYRRFTELVGGTQCPIVQQGYLFLVRGEPGPARARVSAQHSAGLSDVELLMPADAKARFPWLDADAFDVATWCPSDGFLRPDIVMGEAVEALRRSGGSVLLGAPVSAVRRQHQRIEAVQVRDSWIEGDLFVDATNAWTQRTSLLLGGTLLPVQPLKRYLWFLARASALPSETLAEMPLVVTPQGAYCRPENPDLLLTGFAHDATPEPAFSYDDQDRIDAPFYHRSGTDTLGYDVWAQLAESIPALADAGGLTATTSGFYGTTPDHNPYLGYDPQVPNLLRLVGFSGHGAMFGPFTARVALTLAEAGHPLDTMTLLDRTISLAAFSPKRVLGAREAMVI